MGIFRIIPPPYFVGKDIAEVLGYAEPRSAVSKKVDAEDRVLKTLEADSQNGNVVKTQTTLINESGLYALIFGSKLESAKRFKRWVTSFYKAVQKKVNELLK